LYELTLDFYLALCKLYCF